MTLKFSIFCGNHERVLSRISRPNTCRAHIDDFVVENDHVNIKEEDLVKKSNEIFMNMNPAIFKRSWINTGLIEEKEYLEEIDEFEDLDVAEMVLEKEDEENLVENFLALQIDETRPATPMEIEEVPQVQVTDNADAEKPSTSNWPKKQPNITSFFTSN